MDPRLLKLYEGELRHIREMGAEFAAEFPKIAGRLGMDGFDCADPYVERLLEGFAFMAARVQLKMDSEFPQLIQNLLEIVYPQVLTPTPACTIAQVHPDYTSGDLAEGFTLPRHTVMRSRRTKGEQTACEFRTAHDLTLWPIEVSEAQYFSRDVATLELPDRVRHAEAGLRIRLRIAKGQKFSEIGMDRLVFYIRGREELPMTLYEQLLTPPRTRRSQSGQATAAHPLGILVQPARGNAFQRLIDPREIRPVGFEPDQSLIPFKHVSFEGYRLLTEYFLFRERFLFVEIGGLNSALRLCEEPEVDLIVLFNKSTWGLANALSAENILLHCTPAINLFKKRADPIRIEQRRSEHLIIPDRTRPLDLEVFQVERIQGLNKDGSERDFHPFYSLTDHSSDDERAYYALRRTPRSMSSKQKRLGTRSTYLGSDAYVSLVDRRSAPYSGELNLLNVDTLCTNRDLPLQMPVGHGDTDLQLEVGAPVASIRCVAGPTRPRPSLAHSSGEMVWKFISHLSLNYLSISDAGATGIKEMLRLYADSADIVALKQIDGIKSVESSPLVCQVPTKGPITFGRGLAIAITMDEESFEGVGVFLLGAVLERFLAKYTSINSFTQTTLHTNQRQEVAQWPVRIGSRHIL